MLYALGVVVGASVRRPWWCVVRAVRGMVLHVYYMLHVVLLVRTTHRHARTAPALVGDLERPREEEW